LAHPNLQRLYLKFPNLAASQAIQILKNKNKGFELIADIKYQDAISIILTCPDTVLRFIKHPYK